MVCAVCIRSVQSEVGGNFARFNSTTRLHCDVISDSNPLLLLPIASTGFETVREYADSFHFIRVEWANGRNCFLVVVVGLSFAHRLGSAVAGFA